MEIGNDEDDPSELTPFPDAHSEPLSGHIGLISVAAVVVLLLLNAGLISVT